jgi:thioredoxin 1
MVQGITDENFDAEVLKSPVPVLVDFWAEWCGPCRMLGPVIDELAREYPAEKVRIVKLNVDHSPRVAGRYGIMAIPTVVLFKNGQVLEQVTGVRPKRDYQALIDRSIS